MAQLSAKRARGANSVRFFGKNDSLEETPRNPGIATVSYLIEGYLNVLSLGKMMLLIVQFEGLPKRQSGVESANGRHQLLQSRGSIAAFHLQGTMLFDQRLKVAERISACRLQAIEDETMHQHLLHPFDEPIAAMRSQQIVSSTRREGHGLNLNLERMKSYTTEV